MRILQSGASSGKRARDQSSLYAAAAFGIDEGAGVDAVIALAAVAGAATLTLAFGSVGAGAVAFGVAVVGAVARSGRIAGANDGDRGSGLR